MSTILGSVKPRYFADYEMDVFPLSHQRVLAELNALAHREARLLAELAAEKEKYYDLMINQLFTEMKRGN